MKQRRTLPSTGLVAFSCFQQPVVHIVDNSGHISRTKSVLIAAMTTDWIHKRQAIFNRLPLLWSVASEAALHAGQDCGAGEKRCFEWENPKPSPAANLRFASPLNSLAHLPLRCGFESFRSRICRRRASIFRRPTRREKPSLSRRQCRWARTICGVRAGFALSAKPESSSQTAKKAAGP